MTIEIQEPDLEAIIQRRIDSGKFESPKDVIAEALRSSEPVPFSKIPPAMSLMEAFERGRGLGEGVDFNRDQSFDRSSPISQHTDPPPANDLDAMFAEIRGLADDLDFSRIPSTERPVDL